MRHSIRTKVLSALLSASTAVSMMGIISSGGEGVAYASQPPPSQPLPNDAYYQKKTLAPYGTVVQVDEMKHWSPDNDPDARFNRSRVPLAPRHMGPQVNPNASPDARVLLLGLSNGHANTGPSQGGDGSMVYAFTNYQYVDVMNYWGGSSADGCIVAPTPEIIDAAHRNGAKCTGTIFLAWGDSDYSETAITQMVEKDANGHYPFADKLIEMAEYYGFDGWFINAESSIPSALAAQFRDMLAYIQEHKPAGFLMEWYDAMLTSGTNSNQNAVNSSNIGMIQEGNTRYNDDVFLNFNWSRSDINTSISTMEGVGRSPFDIFATWENFPHDWPSSSLENANHKIRTSLGNYTSNATLAQSLSIEEFQNDKEIKLYSTNNGDPRDTTRNDSKWPGYASLVTDKTPILGTEFVTNFNAGSGHKFYEQGAPTRPTEWFNRSLTDILPTWRWMVDSDGAKLKPSFDYSNAWYGGTSLKVAGTLEGGKPNHVKLYSTDLDITADSQLNLVYRESNGGVMQAGLCFGDSYDAQNFVFFDLNGTDAGNGWKTATVDLGDYAGQTAIALSLRFSSDVTIPSYSANVGKIAVTTHRAAPTQVSQPRVEEVRFSDSGHAEARLSWLDAANADFYKVYRLAANGGRTLLNVVNNNVFYASPFSRLPGENSFDFEIVPINTFGDEGTPVKLNFNWDMPEGSTQVASDVAPVNLALHQPAVSAGHSAVDKTSIGKLTDGLYGRDNKWEAPASGSWAVIDLGATKPIGRYIVYNANCPVSAESPDFNTRAWTVSVAPDDGQPLMVTGSDEARTRASNMSFTEVSNIPDNTAGVTYVNLDTPTTGRYVKINVTDTTQGTPWPALRIPELEVYSEAVTMYSDSLPLANVKAVNKPGATDVFEAVDVPNGYTVRLYSTLDAATPLATKTADATGVVLFDTLDFGANQGRIYFTVQDNLGTGNGESLRLSTPFDAETIDPIPKPQAEIRLSARAAESAGTPYGTAVLRDVPAGSRAEFFQNETDIMPILTSGVAQLGQLRSNEAYITQEYLKLNPDGGTYYAEIYKDGYRVSDRFAISYGAAGTLSIDTMPLEEVAAACQGKTEYVYTPESWAPFKAALDHAIACLDNSTLTRDEMHAAMRDLKQAGNALVLTAEYYPITTVVTAGYGTIQTPDAAQEGDTVTVGLAPSEGYKLLENSLSVKTTTGQAVEITTSDAAGFQFAMPGVSVTVSAGFEAILGPDGEAPSMPANLRAENVTTNSATLTWNASTDNVGVTGYRVYTSSGVVATVESGDQYALSGLAAGTHYTVRVTAIDAAGNESEPGVVSFTTLSSGGGSYVPPAASSGTVTYPEDAVVAPVSPAVPDVIPAAQVVQEIKNSSEKSVAVELKGPAVADNDLFGAIRDTGKDLTLAVKSPDGKLAYQWEFAGKDIAYPQISMNIGIQTEDASKKTGYNGMLLEYEHSGILPGSATVTMNVAGYFKDGTQLYYYYWNPTLGNYEEVASGITVKDGMAQFPMTHCSAYLLTNQKVPGAITAPAVPEVTTSPATGDTGLPAGIIWLLLGGLSLGLAAGAVRRTRAFSKRR